MSSILITLTSGRLAERLCTRFLPGDYDGFNSLAAHH